jgi:hypothetical protein
MRSITGTLIGNFWFWMCPWAIFISTTTIILTNITTIVKWSNVLTWRMVLNVGTVRPQNVEQIIDQSSSTLLCILKIEQIIVCENWLSRQLSQFAEHTYPIHGGVHNVLQYSGKDGSSPFLQFVQITNTGLYHGLLPIPADFVEITLSFVRS